jgi:hypothetical protein
MKEDDKILANKPHKIFTSQSAALKYFNNNNIVLLLRRCEGLTTLLHNLDHNNTLKIFKEICI